MKKKRARRSRREIALLRKAIYGLVNQGFTYNEVAKTLHLSGKALVRYHFIHQEKISTGEAKSNMV